MKRKIKTNTVKMSNSAIMGIGTAVGLGLGATIYHSIASFMG